ncbi:hypothetical protein BHY07_21165 [Bacillus subtilis subsp. subtilis]|uniref:Uncharacterized protein YxzC n=5 Tax=Bacilli TaxID=91061 RepID=YXZC_BACSU|nr:MULTISPECIES: hypothetical protein [Bacillales]NP_391799.1 putative nucleic acid binding protein [Bacillus subtilis subsp. subtilis str. 168]O32286.1 RecName: Full=Uncharacterized protein YxzC [Bacillus subtilis subsp. subtilis str. 168]MBG9707968.1 hypothetical protein [Lysinibacillus sphaericus]BAM56005.1 nucleic acid binding protein [Bacillus subtilis BEST7613]AFQ59772.1 Putative nucleic acid binding protein [Bacillus subtilis QB928]AGG63333.1 putative nucleic acid binding protein YxzC 
MVDWKPFGTYLLRKKLQYLNISTVLCILIKNHLVLEYVVIKLSETNLIECINKIKSVLNGQTTREEVSDWAGTYVYADDPEVEDDRVWDMLILLSGIDLKDSSETYLHSTDDLNDWIKQYTE